MKIWKFTGLLALLCVIVLVSQAVQRPKLKELKVLTYNIHHANPPGFPGLINIDTFVRIINREKPDLVALQEVDKNTRRSGGTDQVLAIAHRTGMNCRFFKAIDYDGGEYGIAILSRLPILNANQIALPQPVKDEARVLGYIEVETAKNKRIIFANTHLDARSTDENRKPQMQAILDHFQDAAWPVILAGDFNDVPRSNTLDLFDKTFYRAGAEITSTHFGLTFPQENSDRTLDYIGYKYPKPNVGKSTKFPRLQMTEFSILPETYASDHLPVMVKYRVR